MPSRDRDDVLGEWVFQAVCEYRFGRSLHREENRLLDLLEEAAPTGTEPKLIKSVYKAILERVVHDPRLQYRFSNRQRLELAVRQVLSSVKLPRPFGASARVTRAPGTLVREWTRTLFGERAAEMVFDQTIADLRDEYYRALVRGAVWEARFALFRGYMALARATARHIQLRVLAKTLWFIHL